MRKYLGFLVSAVLVLAGLALCVMPTVVALENSNAESMGKLLPLWNKTWGGPNSDNSVDVIADSTGIYVAGTSNVMSPDLAEIFILKYDSSGGFKWAQSWCNGTNVVAGGMALSGSNIYIGGMIEIAPGDWDGLLIKYDTDGNEIWNKTWGRTGIIDGVNDIVVNGAIYTCGNSDKYGNSDIYVTKFDLDGNSINDQFFGTAKPESGDGIACDGTNVFVCGNIDNSSNQDALLLKLDTDLNEVDTWLWGGADDDMGYEIALDAGSAYIVGATRSYSAGINDICLLKFGKDGSYILNRSWGSTGEDTGYGICLSGGNIYLAGEYNDPVNGADLVLLKYDSGCNYVWNMTWGGPAYQSAMTITADATGLYLAGVVTTGISSDALLMKTNFDGTDVPENHPPTLILMSFVIIPIIAITRKRFS